MNALPVIDVGPLLDDPGSAEAGPTLDLLREACHGPGFCYIAGHRVEPTVTEELTRQSWRFFRLPAAVREELAVMNSAQFRGYTVTGGEQTGGVSDWRDQLELGPEDVEPVLGPEDPPWMRLRGPNQWPNAVPELRPVVLEYMAQMQRLGVGVLRALSTALGQAPDRFDYAVQPRPDPRVRILRYPAQNATTDTGQGIGLHHDSGLLTFILQDEVGGLQVQMGGDLVDAEPIPGTLVMNLGEMLQSSTSGYLRATPHRVQSPPSGVERLSIVYFLNPRLEARFEPIVLPADLARHAPGGQNADASDPVHATFGDNHFKVRLRGHPAVAERFYPDQVR